MLIQRQQRALHGTARHPPAQKLHQIRTKGAQAGINTLLPTSTFPEQAFSFSHPFFFSLLGTEFGMFGRVGGQAAAGRCASC